MGGYGTPVGETKNYMVYLNVNCSSEWNKFNFTVVRKKDHVNIEYEDGCSEKENPDIQKFNEELQKEREMFFIKDEPLRDKIKYELKFRELEKENKKLNHQKTLLLEKLSSLRKIIG